MWALVFALGFILVAAAVYLVDSAAKGRPPIETLKAIVSDPQNARTILEDSAATHNVQNFQAESDLRDLLAEPLSPTGDGVSGIISGAIAFASAQIGKPYKWGAEGPNAFDCSGLIYASYKSVGITIPRTTAVMQLRGTRVARKHLRPGDLIFPDPGHVMLYIGGGRCIESPHTGAVVHYTNIYRFMTARRYV